MADQDSFYKNLIDNLYDGIYFVDRQRVITYWNKGAERITGYSAAQVIGRSCRDNLLNHVTANGTQLCLNDCPLAACMDDGRPRQADVFLHHADGYRLAVAVRASPIHDELGNVIGAVEAFSSNESLDDTRRQLSEAQRAALTDPVTGAGNRRFLEQRLAAAAAEYRAIQTPVGLLFLDVDGFKLCNDAHGHEVGDQVLRLVVADLRHNLRSSDTIGRWGGDEFLAILHNVHDPVDLEAIAEKLRNLVAFSSVRCTEGSVTVTVSIGATLLSSEDTAETLVQRADQLMYRSKQSGRNRVTLG